MTKKFHQAETIRQEERSFKQAKYNNLEMHKMSRKERDALKYQEYTSQLDSVNKRLASLEHKEGELFSNLKKSVTEHTMLLNHLNSSGSLDTRTISASK